MQKWAAGKYGHRIALAMGVLASLVYLWQVAGAWADERTLAVHEEQQRGSTAFFSRSNSQVVSLSGVGVAAGAQGSLRYNSRGSMGLLIVQDMPVLPNSRLYRLWCIDASGSIDVGTSFRVPINSESETVVGVMAPRLLYAYTRFVITIEPVPENAAPTGTVVMVN